MRRRRTGRTVPLVVDPGRRYSRAQSRDDPPEGPRNEGPGPQDRRQQNKDKKDGPWTVRRGDDKDKDKDKAKARAAAVKYVMERRKDKGQTITRSRAKTIALANAKADKTGGRAYKYDFADDGAGVKDRDFGSARNNAKRKAMGTKQKITVKANVKNAKKYGTGKVLVRKPRTA